MLGAFLWAATASANPLEDHRRLKAQVQEVADSTMREWSAAFHTRGQVYAPPRLLLLRSPVGHPARGAGYSPDLGVVIDLNDMAAIGTVFASEGAALAALLVAHEIGHHVQVLTGNEPVGAGRSAKELQADCYAGWWLGRANARSLANRGVEDYPLPNLERRLPEMLGVLAILQAGRLAGANEVEAHGSTAQRLAAIRAGLDAVTPGVCDAARATR